jgi:hypothetical protein
MSFITKLYYRLFGGPVLHISKMFYTRGERILTSARWLPKDVKSIEVRDGMGDIISYSRKASYKLVPGLIIEVCAVGDVYHSYRVEESGYNKGKIKIIPIKT